MDYALRISPGDDYPLGVSTHQLSSTLEEYWQTIADKTSESPYEQTRILDLWKVLLTWSGGSVEYTKTPEGVVRMFMGLSRVLSRAVYGESAGGLIYFDWAIGTPSRLVAIRLSKLLKNESPEMFGKSPFTEPSTLELIRKAYSCLEWSAETI